MKIHRLQVWCFILLMALPLMLASPSSAGRLEKREAKIRQDLGELEQLLTAGEWQKGEKKARKISRSILHKSKPTRATRSLLVDTAFFRAIALANLDRRLDAECYWFIAYNLDHRTAQRNADSFGKAGRVFREFEPRAVGQVPDGFNVWHQYYADGFVRPVEPSSFILPDSLALSTQLDEAIKPPFTVEVLVDEAGRPRLPNVTSDYSHPILIYHYLEWLYEERFEPASLKGEAIAVLHKFHRQIDLDRWSQPGKKARAIVF